MFYLKCVAATSCSCWGNWDSFSGLSIEQSSDYDFVKEAILRAYKLSQRPIVSVSGTI